jgi:uncharacterized membrane protein YvbJ
MPIPTFFCENCGNQVSAEVDSCPVCGKRFGGVKCPRCYFTSSVEEFMNKATKNSGYACPKCHYTFSSDVSKPSHKKYLDKLPNDDYKNNRRNGWPTLIIVLILATLIMLLFYTLV